MPYASRTDGGFVPPAARHECELVHRRRDLVEGCPRRHRSFASLEKQAGEGAAGCAHQFMNGTTVASSPYLPGAAGKPWKDASVNALIFGAANAAHGAFGTSLEARLLRCAVLSLWHYCSVSF
jgi:hypothetical protein